MIRRARAPVWLMGLTNAVFGMYGGVIAVWVPQLLSARHVPETKIAAMTAVMMSPGFWAFLVSPVLDVKFSRRWYAVVTAVLTALLPGLALAHLDRLAWVEGLLVAAFSLTNLLGGLGADFHASARFVALVGGFGVFIGGLTGCFIFPVINRGLPLRQLYLAIGVAGALFTLALIPVARTPAAFAVALIGENVFQALAITASTAIAFATIGPRNPLAATTYCLMVSAFNIPVTYMLFVDGWGYHRHGVTGSYAVDAGLSLFASLLLGAVYVLGARRRRRRPVG